MTCIRISRIIRRMACAMAGLAGGLLALSITSSAAFAYRLPPSGGGRATTPTTLPTVPPGANKHPPLHAAGHTAVIGGMPGWQITLIAIAAAVLAAALAVTADRILAARRRVSTRAA